ncbi:hypothetical protein A1O3_03724 [Capronia epimyces CBS 606.96]|uniref:Uncharacterized protein n=1 Tax=Capronia epimyces CBS 606.96 TaxID=1182542 RepID=W9YAT4_9EURO|nr:uncharacterized protein A1O3_03724 [Capronia epimyces CBS 606.96]EXJ86770.1 hypothetical protein A1O3_03724 [Capronia epimyces CBS 606.96]
MSTTQTPEILRIAISPIIPPPHPSTPSSKRKITPTAEQSSSKRSLIVTTPKKSPGPNLTLGAQISIKSFSSPTPRFPGGSARVVQYSKHAPPSPSPAKKDETWHTQHILLPYDLRDPKVRLDSPEVQTLLRNIFPKCENIAEPRFRSHLIFQVEELPSAPWPLTIGGLPFTFIEPNINNHGLIFPRWKFANFTISVRPDFNLTSLSTNLSGTDLCDLARSTNAEIQKRLPGIHLIELIFAASHAFYVVLADNVNINPILVKLPGKIANCPVSYLNIRDLNRPAYVDLPAKRQVNPAPLNQVVDATAYNTLRPGVMINSVVLKEHGHPATFSTTSGVFVKNSVGNRFMTVASHGVGQNIWQPHRPHRTVGKPVVEIPSTDISLVQLEAGVPFAAETFEDADGVIPRFSRFVAPNEAVEFNRIHLNSPFTGHVEGNVVAQSAKLQSQSSHPTENRLKDNYVLYQWHILGQGHGSGQHTTPPDGTCGSAI